MGLSAAGDSVKSNYYGGVPCRCCAASVVKPRLVREKPAQIQLVVFDAAHNVRLYRIDWIGPILGVHGQIGI